MIMAGLRVLDADGLIDGILAGIAEYVGAGTLHIVKSLLGCLGESVMIAIIVDHMEGEKVVPAEVKNT